MAEEIGSGSGRSKIAKIGVAAAGALVIFLLGLVPMLIQKWSVESRLAETETQLRRTQVSGELAEAMVEANRGEYERARQKASGFFQKLRAEEERGDEGYLSAEAREKIKPVFDARDSVITLLAQRDQASVERLYDVYSTYQASMGIEQPPASDGPEPEENEEAQ